MELGLKGKRALITAASRGLGRASALALAGEGARIAVAARNPEAARGFLDELRDAGAEQADVVHIDLADRDTLASGVDQAAEKLGGLDIFVGNTGGPEAAPFLGVKREGWEAALGESLLPLVDLTHAVLPYMRESQWGRIVYITTVGVKIVQPNMVLSDSIRLAVVGMAKSLSIEFAHEGIMVNCLCPGPFATDRMEYLVNSSVEQQGLSRADAEKLWLNEVPVGKFGDPADFGAFVALLSSERAGFVTGTAIALDGGKSRAY
ncbi:SDR family oxidoreductase [Pelagibacterium montanilacus]|uniref:SDR family oxidoreductase n=1 Tax=Pelagibacterium montanilacus TaxID=2185280 RepID=UPI000F8F3045|nr:SDR family oxidoreductase [Pelagibacterium montanilacus]